MGSVVNGDKPSSAFLQHLISYPVVHDSISTFKSNPYGAKSIEVSNNLTNILLSRTGPYLSGPYSYASPYIHKADSVGDSVLHKVDSSFPAVKKPTGELYDNGKGLVFFPLRKGLEGKDYLLKTYSSEYKKVGGDGPVTYAKAAVTTSLIAGSDALTWLSDFLSTKKAEAKEVTNEKLNN